MTHLSRLRKRLSESGYTMDSGIDSNVHIRSGISNFLIMEAPLNLKEDLDRFLIRFSYPSKVREMSSGSVQFIIKID